MGQGRRTGEICGHPMRFYNLIRPRDDYMPVCHRPPHEGGRHMSKAAADRAREYRRTYDRAREYRRHRARAA
jgi:hypothetical protein